jgi:thiol:disulfide interchange protein
LHHVVIRVTKNAAEVQLKLKRIDFLKANMRNGHKPASCTAILLGLLLFLPAAARGAGADIYPAPEQAQADLSAALHEAASHHKNVILDFGGNWCGDCKVLDIYFHDPVNVSLIDANYVLVHINIGHMDVNESIAERYQIPLAKGVPALAVLDEHGKLIYSQRSGEFEAMRRMDPSSVTSFLLQWKPAKSAH